MNTQTAPLCKDNVHAMHVFLQVVRGFESEMFRLDSFFISLRIRWVNEVNRRSQKTPSAQRNLMRCTLSLKKIHPKPKLDLYFQILS